MSVNKQDNLHWVDLIKIGTLRFIDNWKQGNKLETESTENGI